MIDLVLYRYRIGSYSNGNGKRSKNVSKSGNCVTTHRFMSAINFLTLAVFYIYFIVCVLSTSIGMLLECKLKFFTLTRFHGLTDVEMIHSHLTHVKLLSSILIGFLITRDLIIYVHFGCCFGLIKKLFSVPKFEFTKGFIQNLLPRFIFILSQCIIWTFVLNSSLIVLVNPSLLNPGPLQNLKVATINCQGLIPY